MSDLEQGAVRAPIITSAIGKLRSLSGNTREFGGIDGLVDAFAEVFAQMAIAAPPAAQSSESTTDSSHDSDQEVQQSAESSDGEQQDDGESSETSSVEAVLGDQALVAQQQDDTPLDGEAVIAEQVAVQGVSGESSDENGEHQTEQNRVVTGIEAPSEDASASQVESDQVADTPVVTNIDANPERRDRRDRNSQDGKEAPKGPAQRTELETKPKTGEIRADQKQQEDGSDQGGTLEQQSSEPAERTTRQKFLDQRRSEHRGGDEKAKQTADSGVQKQTESNAESQGATETAPTTAPPKAPAAPRVGAVAQATADAAAGANKTSAKATVSQVGGRGEAKTGNQSVQNEPGNRIDRGTDRETRPAKSDASSMAARVKLVQRVSRAFQHLGPEGGMIRLRLAPAELGSVRVEMQINQRKVQARVVAETEAASNALREHLPDLRARLESYGMQVERLDVETESPDQQNGSPFEHQTQQRESQQRETRRETAIDRKQLNDDVSDRREAESLTVRPPALASQGVDLRL